MNRKRILIFLFFLMITAAAAKVFPAAASPDRQSGSEIELINEEPAETASEPAEEETAGTEETVSETLTEEEETPVPEEEEETPEPPEAPVPENPQGNFRSKAIGFYWKPSLNAEYYEINWQNDRGYSGTLQMENDDWTCKMDRCILYAELPSDGNYTWTVTAVNTGGSAVSEEMAFNVPSLIPAPDAYRPNSTLSNQKPLIFEWEDVGFNATAFRIQAADVDSDQICLDLMYGTDAVRRMNGICYLETEEYLPSGSYVWRVRVIGGTDVSEWSSWVTFDVNCAECNLGTYLNTSTAAVFPNGTTVDPNPEFAWKAITGAQNYQLELKDPLGVILLNESVPAENCSVELCTFRPELTLEPGDNYTWIITAYGWNNSYWGEDGGAFSISSPDVEMQDIQFVRLADSIALDPDNRQIIWTDPGVTTATFRLGIRDSEGEWLFVSDLTREEAWCDGITCSIQFYEIPEGEDYEIVIIPLSEFNIHGKTVSMTFSNQPAAADEEQPAG